MIKKLLLYLAVLYVSYVKAQSPDVIFDKNNYNVKYLENLLKINLDSIRNSYNLQPLLNDSILYVSAKQHVKYCKNRKNITHRQESRKYKNPQNRVESNGADGYIAGEIICRLALDTGLSYKQLADTLSSLIISDTVSKAHLLSEMYNIIGLAAGTGGSAIYIVADIAQTEADYRYKPNKKLFPFDNLEVKQHKKTKYSYIKSYGWKIKAPKKESDFENTKRTFDRLKKKEVKKDGTRLSVIFDSESSVKQIIEKKKDGFAIELVSFDDYDCTSKNYYKPARRNKHSLLNGVLMKPRYYNDIFKKSGYGDEKQKYFIKDIGSIKNGAGIFEANAVLFKKNRIVAIIKPSHICGSMLKYSPEKLPYLDNLYNPYYEPDVDYDTLKLKIYFGVGETQPESEDIGKIIEFVKKEGLVITKAYVNANASIEGSAKVNEMLFNKRAENITALFENEQDYHIQTILKTQENWDLFFMQIKNTRFANLAYKDTAYIKYFVKDSIDYFREMLDKQRYAQVNLFAVTKATRDKFKVFALNEYKKLIPQIIEAQEKNKLKLANGLLEKAEAVQLFLFDQYNRKKIGLNFVNLLKIPDKDIFANLRFNRLMFDFKYVAESSGIDETSFFNSIKTLSSKENICNLVFYNFVAYLINHYGEDTETDYTDSKKFLNLIQKMGQNGIDNEYVKNINLHLNYLRTLEFYESREFKRARKSLAFIADYYQKKENISAETIVNVAEYYILFNEFEKAKKIVAPIANCSNPNHNALILYLKLHYMNYWEKNRTEEYYSLLFEASKILSNDEWCGLFAGDCNISFQIFDYEPLWKFYCLKKQKGK